MKGKLVIQYQDNCKRVDYQFEESLSYDLSSDYLVWVTLPRGRTINLKEIKIGLNKYLLRKLNGKTYQRDFPDRVELLKEAYSNDIDILDNCDSVEIIDLADESIDSIMAHPSSKIIIKDKEHPLTIEEVERLERKYAGKDNIYVYVDENESPVSLEDYRTTVEEITAIANRIKAYGLSPLEAAIYAYDYARDRLYVEEQSNDYTDSRDLTKVLLGDEIVCVGYSRILNAILKKSGITSSLYRVNSEDGSHALTIARITDEKYDIDSIYYIDATKGRKHDDTNNHFYSYKSFAMTRGEALAFGYYEDETFGKIDIDEYKRVAQAILNGELVRTYLPDARQSISNIIKFLDGKSVYEIPFAGNSVSIKEVPDAVEKLELMYQLLSTQIEPTKLVSAIERVRQVEYYENPYKFPYSKDTIRAIGTMSKSDFSFYPYADKQLEKMYQEHEEDYDKTRLRIDLVKVLKKVKEQKEK